jgi:hypothetical protein
LGPPRSAPWICDIARSSPNVNCHTVSPMHRKREANVSAAGDQRGLKMTFSRAARRMTIIIKFGEPQFWVGRDLPTSHLAQISACPTLPILSTRSLTPYTSLPCKQRLSTSRSDSAFAGGSRSRSIASCRGRECKRREGFMSGKGGTSLSVLLFTPPDEKKSVRCQEGGREVIHLVLRPLPMQTRPICL